MLATFTALAEPNRLRIVDLLLDGPRSVNTIGETLRLRQPQVSKHLSVLKQAGLVDVEPRAQQRLYALRPAALRELNEWLERYRRIWDERMNQLDELLGELQQNQAAKTDAPIHPKQPQRQRPAAKQSGRKANQR